MQNAGVQPPGMQPRGLQQPRMPNPGAQQPRMQYPAGVVPSRGVQQAILQHMSDLKNGKKQDQLFRIKLILSHYFTNHKAKTFVYMNSDWNTVQNLHAHIKELFGIYGFVLKTGEGVYLPDQESIQVIQPGDDISVIPRDIAEMGEKPSPEPVKKAGFGKSLAPTDSTEMEQNHSDEPTVSDTDDLTNVRKRKRVRRRKNNRVEHTVKNGNIFDTSKIVPAEVDCVRVERKKIDNNRDAQHKSNGNKHIRFDDDGSISEPDAQVDLPKKARIVAANVTGEVGFRLMTSVTEPNGEIVESSLLKEAEIEQSDSVVTVSDREDGTETTHAEPESALEQLAKNLETVGKYKELIDEAKPNDIIAFKVFTPNFEKSGYVIALVESINTRNHPNDYDLILTIMAGTVHIEHLRESDETDNTNQSTIQIGINRMDLFDAKVIEL